MPSTLHELLAELFRKRPDLAADLLAGVGVPIPEHVAARTAWADLSDLAPAEFRADAVVVLEDATGRAVLAIVAEAQLSADPDKRLSWPVYVAGQRARLKCPVVLLVVCTDSRVAAWAATPIELGPHTGRLTPTVLGPEQVPPRLDRSAGLEAAVLPALVHGGGPLGRVALGALLELADVAGQAGALYLELVYAVLSAAGRRLLEELMSTEAGPELVGLWQRAAEIGRSEGKAEGKAEGLARGRADMVLRILDHRRVSLTGDERARIAECTDLAQLDTWGDLALTATTAAELFR
ncbi:MAG: hypothetical protein ACT4QG_10945 [Sporichthyaceae bacterium]